MTMAVPSPSTGRRPSTNVRAYLFGAAAAAACLPVLLFAPADIPNETPLERRLRVGRDDNGLAKDRNQGEDGMSAFYRAAAIPVPAYTSDLAREAVRPSPWRCGGANDRHHPNNRTGARPHRDDDERRTLFAFVHVYKAAGTTVRRFFHELSYACRRTWVCASGCTNVRPSSLRSRGRWTPCRIEGIANGRDGWEEAYDRKYVPARGDLIERGADIVGGHARIGTYDYVFSSSSSAAAGGGVGEVRYIVFLRDPMERYVSGVLYQNKVHGRTETLERVVGKIKERVHNAREADRYWDKSLSYLLTPDQRVENERWDAEEDWNRLLRSSRSEVNGTVPSRSAFAAETRCRLAMRNLAEYNAIVGFTERMPESLGILRRVFLREPAGAGPEDDAEAVFAKFGHSDAGAKVDGNATTPNAGGGFKANASHKDLSTATVMAALALDREHMRRFQEYVKYERRITDFARTMHTLQYNAVLRMTAQS